jgi:hypothetical protein
MTRTHAPTHTHTAFGKAIVLCMAMAGIGIALANFLLATVPLPRVLAGDALVAMFVNVFLAFAANFFQVQCVE